MEKEVRVGKTTKLIRETEKDTIGLVVSPPADRYMNKPIEEEEIIIEETVEAKPTQIPLDEKIPSEPKPLPTDPIDPPSPPLDNPDIPKTDKPDERKEQKRKNRKNFLLLALGGLALLFVANN